MQYVSERKKRFQVWETGNNSVILIYSDKISFIQFKYPATIRRINLSNSGNYLVADSYSTTLNNEKKLVDDLIENISEKIQKKISSQLNDI